MRPDVYIIKVDSVEEKYLKKIGIHKKNLEKVTNTYSLSYYYGETTGYRVRGLDNVKDFCVKLLKVLECEKTLSEDEKMVMNRLKKMIKAVDKRVAKDIKIKNDREKTANIVEDFFLKIFPNALESEKEQFFNILKVRTFKSMEELEQVFLDIFGPKLKGWKSAQKDFSRLKTGI